MGDKRGSNLLLALSIVFVVIPIAALAWLFASGPLTTVDNLFTTLILLTIAGVFSISVLFDLKERGLTLPLMKKKDSGKTSAKVANTPPASPLLAASGVNRPASPSARADQPTHIERGVVQDLQFFEVSVGQANKSFVTLLPDGGGEVRTIMFVGNVQNLVPLGERVELTCQTNGGMSTLLSCRHLYGNN